MGKSPTLKERVITIRRKHKKKEERQNGWNKLKQLQNKRLFSPFIAFLRSKVSCRCKKMEYRSSSRQQLATTFRRLPIQRPGMSSFGVKSERSRPGDNEPLILKRRKSWFLVWLKMTPKGPSLPDNSPNNIGEMHWEEKEKVGAQSTYEEELCF